MSFWGAFILRLNYPPLEADGRMKVVSFDLYSLLWLSPCRACITVCRGYGLALVHTTSKGSSSVTVHSLYYEPVFGRLHITLGGGVWSHKGTSLSVLTGWRSSLGGTRGSILDAVWAKVYLTWVVYEASSLPQVV